MSDKLITKMPKAKPRKFSYSKLNTYDSCGWKYKLTYEDNHFIFTESLANTLGVTIHYCEQKIFEALKMKEPVDYDEMRNLVMNINIEKKDKFDTDGGIYGVNILKERYREEFYTPDSNGQSYASRVQDYLDYGIYRLENYLKDNPNLEPFDAEKYFSFEFRGFVFNGYIDRIFYNKEDDSYIIEDIKTKNKLFKDDQLITPLQFVIYALGLHECLDIPYEKMSCYYDLPFLGVKQKAGTSGFIKRGINKINKIFDSIEEKDWEPTPSPLCYWCAYSATNPAQPEEGKNLCPYYSLWTTTSRERDKVSHKWRGMAHVEEDLADEERKNKAIAANGAEKFDFDF